MLSEEEVAKLSSLATVLLPGGQGRPGTGQIQDFQKWLRVAAGACGYPVEEIRAALALLPAYIDWEQAKALQARQPDLFHIASTLASAAYYMAPEVLHALGFPADRKQPAEVEEFLEQYETGILDAVIARGPRYRVVAHA